MSARAASCIALIPAKPLAEAKSRLAGALSSVEREDLVEAMLRQVIDAAMAANAIDQIVMLGRRSPDYPLLDVIDDPGGGLNMALRHGMASVAKRGAGRVVILAGDLPLLEPAEVDRLATLEPDTIGIASDRHGTGTNALSLPLPSALDFRFAYGPGSFAEQCSEVQRLGLRLVAIEAAGLARDIDDPADLADIQGSEA